MIYYHLFKMDRVMEKIFNLNFDVKNMFRQFQSEIYGVLDCSFTDMINSISNNKWTDVGCSSSTDGDVKVVTSSTTNAHHFPATTQSSSWDNVLYFPPSFVCEFEVTEIDRWRLQLYDNSVNQTSYIEQTGKYKIVYDGTSGKFYKDDSTTPFSTNNNFTGLDCRIGVSCFTNGGVLKYKNFKIYPI